MPSPKHAQVRLRLGKNIWAQSWLGSDQMFLPLLTWLDWKIYYIFSELMFITLYPGVPKFVSCPNSFKRRQIWVLLRMTKNLRFILFVETSNKKIFFLNPMSSRIELKWDYEFIYTIVCTQICVLTKKISREKVKDLRLIIILLKK